MYKDLVWVNMPILNPHSVPVAVLDRWAIPYLGHNPRHPFLNRGSIPYANYVIWIILSQRTVTSLSFVLSILLSQIFQ
jgi:hypothetical protein